MRRTLLRSAKALSAESSFGRQKSIPYVCASCRNAAALSPRVQHSGGRAISNSARRQQDTAASEAAQQAGETSLLQTHYDFFKETFPRGQPPASPFSPDLKKLRKEFLQLQAKSHPDLAPEGQKRQSEAMSMRINEAYKVLQDPLKRAQYLLSLQGIDVEDESAKMSGGPLLMEVMEAREEVEEAESEEDLLAMRSANGARIADSVKILDEAFAKSDMDSAAQEAVRLRYWKNIEESIQGWDKGKGGGVIHH